MGRRQMPQGSSSTPWPATVQHTCPLLKFCCPTVDGSGARHSTPEGMEGGHKEQATLLLQN